MKTPTQESVYLITDDKGTPVTMIRNRVLYSVDPLDDEGIARSYNGGDHLPLIPNALSKLPE